MSLHKASMLVNFLVLFYLSYISQRHRPVKLFERGSSDTFGAYRVRRHYAIPID